MKKELKAIFKGITFLMILFTQSLLQAQTVTNIQCQNSLPMQDPIRLKITNDGSTLTNAISVEESTVIENTGINNITVYIKTVKIPYYDNFLKGKLTIETSSFCTYTQSGINSSTQAKLVVNNSQMVGNTYSSNINLALGNYNFDTNAKCIFPLGSSHICSRKYFRIKVVKEPTPIYNISFSRYCMIDNHTNQYNGHIGIRVNGTITNVNNRLFLNTTNTANTCLTNTSTNLGTITYGTGNYNNLLFYNCTSSTTYTTKLIYTYYNIVGSLISREIPNGESGWIGNYVFTKTFSTCMPVMDPKDPKFVGRSAPSQTTLFPNPTNGILKINVSETDGEIKSVRVYDLTNIKLLELNSLKSNEIDLSNFKNGTYIVHIETSNGLINKQIIKN